MRYYNSNYTYWKKNLNAFWIYWSFYLIMQKVQNTFTAISNGRCNCNFPNFQPLWYIFISKIVDKTTQDNSFYKFLTYYNGEIMAHKFCAILSSIAFIKMCTEKNSVTDIKKWLSSLIFTVWERTNMCLFRYQELISNLK